jgi:formyl-CoA transferase
MIMEGDEGVCAASKMRLVGSPIRMSGAPTGVRRPPPRLGEHTEEILAEARDHATVAAK